MNTPYIPVPKYAVISLEDDQRYPEFTRRLKGAFSDQIQAMIEPSIKAAAENFVYNLFERSSEERYSKNFLEILHSAVVTALSDPSLGLSNEEIAWQKGRIEALEMRERQRISVAANIRNLMNNIQMTGNPQEIKALVDFIASCANEGIMP